MAKVCLPKENIDSFKKAIKGISRSKEGFLLDITVSGQSLICPQDKTENLEKQFYFLKGKNTRFYGTFTYYTYFGYDGLVVDNCTLIP